MGSDSQWLPIETAPKDGTSVIIGAPEGVGEAWCSADDLVWRWMDGEIVILEPTVWQPLPTPPGYQ